MLSIVRVSRFQGLDLAVAHVFQDIKVRVVNNDVIFLLRIESMSLFSVIKHA